MQAQYQYHLDHFDCESKWFEYQERNDTSKENTEHYFRISRGCFNGKIGSMRKIHGANEVDEGIVICGLRYETCLCNYKHPLFDFIITSFNHYNQHGEYPFEGSVADQPAHIVEIFAILNMVKGEHQYKLQQQHKTQ